MTGKLFCEVEKTAQSGQDFSVRGVLEKLGLSVSGYYCFHGRKPSETSLKKDKVMDKILEIYDKSNQIYGAPKICEKLMKAGIFVSERTVSKYMKELNIHACWVKKSIKTTINPDFSLKLKNILVQRFDPESPNEIWCTDITYIWTMEGFVYLCCIMDLYSRKIIAWELSKSLDSNGVVSAIEKSPENLPLQAENHTCRQRLSVRFVQLVKGGRGDQKKLLQKSISMGQCLHRELSFAHQTGVA